jgi:hypothetical protein
MTARGRDVCRALSNSSFMTIPRKTSLALSDIRFTRGTPFRTAREHREALSLIRRLAVSAGVTVSNQALRAVILEPLTGSRSAARVFKLTPLFGPWSRAKGSPVVVKIAPRAEGISEKANYDKFVRRSLPSRLPTRSARVRPTRAYAGLCWSFAGRARESGVDTLTDCLQRGDATKVELVLRRIFDPLRDTWYSPAQFRVERDIARRYLDRYFTGPRSTAGAEATLRACAARYFNARQEDGRHVIGRAGVSPAAHAALLIRSGAPVPQLHPSRRSEFGQHRRRRPTGRRDGRRLPEDRSRARV